VEYVTRSGLVVTDRRHDRAEAEHPAWSDLPNTNPPAGSVGPNIARAGDVMGDWDLLHAQPFDGWPGEWATPLFGHGSTEPWSGYGYGRFSPDLAGKVSTVMTCVDLNTRQLASMPAYGMKGALPVGLPSWAANPEPAVYADWTEFMKAAVNSYQLRGEVILYATGRNSESRPVRFLVLNPDAVDVEMVDGALRFGVGGVTLDRDDVSYVRYQMVPGHVRGVGPLTWTARNVLGASSLERYGADLASRGGIPWAVLKHPANLKQQQATDLKAAWVTAARSRNGAPAVLSGGVELQTLTLSPTDMALLDLRVFDEQRIAAAFGVPPFLVGLPQPGGMTYANAESLFDFHWRATLRPMANALTAAWSSWLLSRGTRMELNHDEYVRPGPNERASYYGTLFGIVDPVTGQRAITVDEIRAAERFGDVDVANTAATAIERLTSSVTA
jgi:HK97 family phage portal protein